MNVTRRNVDVETGMSNSTQTVEKESSNASGGCFTNIIGCITSTMQCLENIHNCIHSNAIRCCYRYTTRGVRNCLRLSFAGIVSAGGGVISSSTWTVGCLGTNGAAITGSTVSGAANLFSTYLAYETTDAKRLADLEGRLSQAEQTLEQLVKNQRSEESEISEAETEDFLDGD